MPTTKKLPDNLRIDRETCSNAGAGWGNMVNDTPATTEVVFSKNWSPTKFTIWRPASPKQARLSWMVDAAGEHYSCGASQVSSASLCSWQTLAWNQQLQQQQQYHQAHPWHHHFFGRTQPSVHCLIGHGGAADKKKTVEQVAKK